MVGEFANLSDVLKQVYSAKMFTDMVNKESAFRDMLAKAHWGSVLSPEMISVQLAALLGEVPIDCDEHEWDEWDPEILTWVSDVWDNNRWRYLEEWRDGTLESKHEARSSAAGKAHRRSRGSRQAHHPPTQRTPLKAQQPRRRPRGRSRSTI